MLSKRLKSFAGKAMCSAKELFTSLLLLSLGFRYSVSTDTVTPNQPIKDGDILVSTNKTFALGFFSPPDSSRRFVGIWYYQLPEAKRTVVWVANRDNPLNDTSGVLSINGQGNLVLNSKNGSIPFWSTNASVSSMNNSMARLLDSGNLVLVARDGERVAWQSFDYPSNTMLPFMKLGLDRRTGFNRYLTSWKSAENPGTGNCSYAIDPSGYPQLFAYKAGAPFWRAGSWTGQRWSGVAEMTRNFIFNVSYVNNQDEISITYGVTVPNVLTRMVLDESGITRRSTWRGSKWVEFWSDPKESCDNYRECGPNSYCDPTNPDKFECTCLPGFEPMSASDWSLRDGSGGCVRKKGVSTCRSGEGFVKLRRVKTPDTSIARVDMSLSLKESQYAKRRSLIRNKGILAVLTVSVALLLLLGVSTVYWLVMKKKRESTSRKELDGSTGNSDLPFFDLSTIVAATDHFSVANKLGEGGFGSVLKGVLSGGKEIAIKRLSKHSGQGIEEFKNEVAIIAKLQHRNLVRILGYCVQGEEKMLIYEYLPNRSLDSFIFEYAMQGLFSVKSDVYSFGVLLLEIITGKKNSTFYHDGPTSNLIGHVWDLWREGSAMEIVDSSLGEKYPANEVSRCIHVGLLCVQNSSRSAHHVSSCFHVGQ
ncbi:G-type lectin S-receptor-like serine/threonine-protein kinase RKS1 [Morella rubra]|uniref:G-type lectin S-receptor-like serine/threonine-protein kinase RKS1 n=1 Tax=Morella rubra TaxID=262757 RepID=A0A6A1WCQ5_9ROSI|nr:G-type lectin S-receptor-like serine/threonine-protein kinase RKS1 [Morella rubra]